MKSFQKCLVHRNFFVYTFQTNITIVFPVTVRLIQGYKALRFKKKEGNKERRTKSKVFRMFKAM